MRQLLLRALISAMGTACVVASATDFTFTGSGNWSTASNWAPAGVPGTSASDTVTMAVSSNNDLGTVGISELRLSNNANITGSALRISSQIYVGTGLSQVPSIFVDGPALSYLSESGEVGLQLGGPIAGTAASTFTVYGPIVVGNVNSSFAGTLTATCWTANQCGALIMAGGAFSGDVVSRSTTGFGYFAKGLTSNGLLVPSGGSFIVTALHLQNTLYKPALGSTMQAVTVNAGASNAVDISGSTLAPSFQPGTFMIAGTVFRVIDNLGTAPVVGTFDNLPEGAFLTVAGTPLRISYVGGTGNDVTLTLVLAQTINFTQPSDLTFASPAPSGALTASGGGSGNRITFTSTTPTVCTTSGSTVRAVGAGTCSIEANQAGSGSYGPATPVTRSFNIAKGTQGISIPFINDEILDTFYIPVHATSTVPGSSGNPIVISSLSPHTCEGVENGQSVHMLHAGVCSLAANQAGDANWNDAPTAVRSFNIHRIPSNLSESGPSFFHVGDVAPVYIHGAVPNVPVTFTSASPSICSMQAVSMFEAALTFKQTGSCSVVVQQNGDDDHEEGGTAFNLTVQAAVVGAVASSRTDFNTDGRSDLVWQRTDGLAGLWLMNGATQTGGGLLFGADTGWLPQLVGDLNGDGHADIVWVNDSDGRVAVWLMNGFTQAGGAVIMPTYLGWTPVMLGDFNGDGKQDILWQKYDGTVALWLMDGATQIGGSVLFGPNTGWSPRMTADFNGDGKSDIVWQHTDGRTAVWLMNGLVQSGGAVLLPANTGWSPRLTGDFNGDGKADLVWEHTDGRAALWTMNGLTQTGGGVLFPGGTGWRSTRVGDLNGDGKADIVWQKDDGTVAVWLMNGATQAGGAVLVGPNTGWLVRRVADFSGDGMADIVMQNVDGSYAMWIMSGLTGTMNPLMPANLGWVLMK